MNRHLLLLTRRLLLLTLAVGGSHGMPATSRADDRIRAGAAGATEGGVTAAVQELAAMRADACRGRRRRRGEERGVGHLRNIRRVTA